MLRNTVREVSETLTREQNLGEGTKKKKKKPSVIKLNNIFCNIFKDN